MNLIKKSIMAIPFITAITGCSAQTSNEKTETVKIYGNCEMCEKTIEEAAYKKGVAKADWNPDTKMAVITYDYKKQTLDEILKRVALSGYDNEKYLAPDEAYSALPGCCKYERTAKKQIKTENAVTHHNNHAGNKDSSTTTNAEKIEEVNQLKAVYEAYFELKDALIRSDSKMVAGKATALSEAVDKADMGKMNDKQHNAWMKVYKTIGEKATAISKSSNIEAQRKAFVSLSDQMIQLAPDAQLDFTIYQQHCPMYNDGDGADWLSKENAVKNPYYGSQMLTCGKTVKTIK